MDVRSLSQEERKEFESILREKLDLPHLRDLSRNPMQLTILLSLIHTKGAALPDKRTSLYDSYVDLFFSRESTKNSIVRKHLELLKDIHRYLGWILHSKAETGRGPGSDGRLTSEELRGILISYFQTETRDPAIVEEIFNAMLERVVMIVSRIEGTHEFEVQPLREYFAARFLYDTAPYSPTGKVSYGTKPDRFDAISTNRYWLNVTRYFCGCFSKGELLDLADRVKDLMTDPKIGKTRHPYIMAVMLLSDFVFDQSSKAVKQLVEMVVAPQGIRHVLPNETNFRPEEPLRIPYLDRNHENRIFEYFRIAVISDSETQSPLARLILTNIETASVFKYWTSETATSLDLDLWLRGAFYLHILRDLPVEDLTNFLQNKTLSESAIAFIWIARNDDLLLRDSIRSAQPEKYLLNNTSYWPNEKAITPPFFLMRKLLNSTSGMHSGPDVEEWYLELLKVIESFLDEMQNKNIDPELSAFSAFEYKCFRVSKKIAAAAPKARNFRSIEAWTSVFEIIEDEFGYTSMFTAFAATLVMHIPSKSRLAAPNLFDQKVSLITRLLSAKRSSKQWSFWNSGLKYVRGQDSLPRDRSIFALSFLAFSPRNFWFTYCAEISSFFESLNPEEWEDILPIFLELINSVKRHATRSAEMLPATARSRFAYILAMQNKHLAMDVFFKYFLNDNSDQPYVRFFRTRQIFQAAQLGRVTWDAALQMLKMDRGTGAYFEFGKTDLPEIVRDKVLANPEAYPMRLWEKSQSDLSNALSKSALTVAQISKKDKWF